MSYRNNKANRVLAALLTVLMIVTMVPASVVTAFAIPNTTTYNFTVKDVDDNPIEDVTFTFDAEGIDEVKTDADGKAAVSLPENTECKYVAEKLGYKKVEGTIDVDTATEIELQLEALAIITVAGVVRDDENQPLENVEIAVTGYCEYNTITDANGEFTITNVYADQEYTLTATLDGYKKVSQKLVLDASNEITLSLKEKIADFGFNKAKVTYKYTTDVISGVVAKSETYADAKVKYSSSDDTIATVNENTGDITPVSVGEVVITATVAETDEYLETTATVTVVIKKGTQADVEWVNSVPADLTWKDTFTNVLSGGNGGAVTYSSNDESIAEVDPATGKVTFLKPGEVEITGIMDGGDLYENAKASYTIKAGKAEQDALEFKEKYPDAIFYGDEFKNAAIGGSVEGNVEYKSSDDTIASVDANGAITTHKSGVVEITATIAENELYEAISASYELTIYKAEQKKEFLFAKGDSDKEIPYGADFENPAMGGENSPITYSSSDDTIASVDSNGKITTHKAGTVTITATNPEDDRFNKKEISYKLTVTLAEQDSSFEDTVVPAITYGDDYVNKVKNAKTEVEYSSSDETVAKVDAKTGKLEILKAGTVEITAKAKETNQYKAAETSYTLTINKADQVISFELNSTPTTTFNHNGNKFINAATTNAILAGETDISCVYSIVGGSEFVDGTIDKNTGEFKIKGAGTIVVSVAFDSNDRYNLATASYTLVVDKANQSISFPKETYETTSEFFFNLSQPVATENGKHGTGNITYSVKADSNAVISEIDATTGKIQFTRNPGTATILATKAADANYNETTAEYKVTYKLISVNNPTDYYTLSGAQIDADSGWFTGNVSIVAKEGYQLSYEKNRKNADWKNELSDAVTEDGENKVTFYAKDIEKDSVTSQITVIIKKDTVAPVATLKVEDISAWDKLLTFLKEGKAPAGNAAYEAQTSDATSKVAETVYYVDYTTTAAMSKAELDALDESVWTTNEPITKNSVCVVYARVTDNAGNYVYVSSNGIVFDAEKPGATITLSSTAEGTDYYTEDVQVTIDVTDAQPSSGIKEVTYKTYSAGKLVDNVTKVYTDKADPAINELIDTAKIEFTLEAEKHNSDNVQIDVIAVDNAGNEYTTSKTLKISTKAPVISVKYQELAPQGTGTDGVVYYNENREAYVTIQCRTSIFDKDAATNGIVVTAKNAKGADVAANYEIGKWVTVEGNTPDEATHTATITFKENARYNFTVDYTDKALLSAEQYKSDVFAIDKDVPTGTVTVNGNTWSLLLEKLTFGFWTNDKASVTADADDVTGEIKKIEYYKSNSDEIITSADLKALAASAWTEYSEHTVSVDEQFTVYFRITDYANNVTYICSDGYIVDKNESTITLTPEEANENGKYNDDVEVNISVNDKNDNNNYYSGIQKVEYWVTADGAETQREVLYSYEYVRAEGDNSNGGTLTIKEKGKADIVKEDAVPTKADLKLEFSKDITVDSKKNNSSDVKVFVEVTDNAGNVSKNEIALDINVTAPEINVSYDTNVCNDVNGKSYFATNREATVIITARPNAFNAEKATNGIVIQALDVNGNVPVDADGNAYVDADGNAIFDENGYVIDKDSFISEWKLTENKEEPDESTFEAKIKYEIDANYTFAISYTDEAGNANTDVVYAENTVAPNEFTVDKTDPTATVSVADNTWSKLLSALTFGLWSNETVTVTATAEDITSPVHIQYYKTDSKALLTEAELEAVTTWVDYTDKFEIADDERLTVYLKVTDDAGNYIYINSDGYIVDKTDSAITLTPEEANENGKYNDDVEVNISVNDKNNLNDHYAGIQKVEYWVEADGVETQREVLYSYEYVRAEGANNNGGTLTIKEKDKADIVKENAVPTAADLKDEFSKTITVEAAKNNSCDVKVFVTVTDNAGNVSNNEIALDIDITAPEIDVTYDTNVCNTVNGKHYFATNREATVIITERPHSFDAEKATAGIVIQALDVNGNVPVDADGNAYVDADGNAIFDENGYVIDKDSFISEWKLTENAENPDASTFEAKIKYEIDANYTFAISYTDEAGNANTDVVYAENTVAPNEFTVDKTDPTATVSIADNTWNKLLEVLTFGLWSNETVTVTATAEDITSPVHIQYYKTDSKALLTEAELEAVTTWVDYTDKFEIADDERLTVYLKVTDDAGNYIYINSDGYIVDKTDSAITLTPEEANANGVYSGDVEVLVSVNDKNNLNDYYSGIQKVEYWVEADGVETQREVLYSYEYVRAEGANNNGGTLTIKEKDKADIVKENAVPTAADLKDEFSKTITVEAAKNNSSDVKVFVEVTDNAGNVKRNQVALDIDITAPTIDVTFNNNAVNKVIDERGYFPAERVATVVITERANHFDKVAATNGITITATDVSGETVIEDCKTIISEWTTSVDTKDPDKTTHTATITFAADANYSFNITYTDMADNVNKPVVYADNTVTPNKFTVDKTDPTATVSVADNTWNKFLSALTFGLWSNDTVTVTATADDVTSPVHIQYYKTDNKELLTEAELEAVTTWVDYTDKFEIADDERLTVYLKVTDDAGNYIYINSDGYIVDKTDSAITLTPDAANAYGLYNGDVDVLISVNDKNNLNDYYSGIQKVEYWVTADGVETQREVLYSYEYVRAEGANSNGGTLTIKEKGKDDIVKENAVPTAADLKKDFVKTITVEAAKNNSSNVIVFVEVTDNAGNVKRNQVALDIDITAPTIDVTYDNNAAYKVVGAHGYFPAERVATVVITERANHFDKVAATNGITITATDVSGETVIEDCKTIISEWTTSVDTKDPDKTTHTATITFAADANYSFNITYTDMADNVNKPVVYAENTVTPNEFTVDKTAPTGTVTVGELGTWDKLIEFLTFGLWSKDTVEVSKTAADATGGIESVSYFKTAQTVALTEEELMAIADEAWVDFNDAYEVPANEQFTVYVRIVDNAGNVTFISTDGIIVDNVKPDFIPALEDTKPEIVLATIEDPINGIYKSDVTVAVKVKDPEIGGAYSGLKEIKYEITNMGEKTQEGVLYSFGEKMPTKENLLQVWIDEAAIIVDSTKNNSNDVVVKVYAVDNAGNENEVTLSLKVDITAPTINVSYNNNDGDTNFKESTYFKKNRVATIVVTERNFNPEDVVLTIANTHGKDKVPAISGWKTVTAEGNGDATTHTATLTYAVDGDYTFDISYIDLAGNENTKVNYGKSLAPKKFTIDKTAPTFTVTYDNNSALNGNYYKAQRVATIVVTEHNFETSRVDIKRTATDNGRNSDLPAVSKWVSNGDIHTATITYAADSRYTFDFDYIDKAGNKTADMQQQEFYVDKTNPAVSISGIVDNSANNAEKIGFVLTATDTNFDSFAPQVTVTDVAGNHVNAGIGGVSDVANGKSYVVNNIEADGIYRVTCTVVDKAGNAFTQVTLQRADGSTYVENRAGNDTLITFSVNRDGSTFELDKATAKLVDDYYVQDVYNDVVISEVNVDELSEFKVTLNGKALVQGKDYTVAQTGGNGTWRKYTYTIKKSLFESEGKYKVVVSSKDAAGNDAYSDIKDATIEFVVDKTKPEVTVAGLSSGKNYRVEEQTVILIPSDDGALKSILVRLVDEDGNPIGEPLINKAGEALYKALEEGDGKLVFKIGSGVNQNVQIICNDEAVDADGKTNTYNKTFNDVDISASAWELFWSDPLLSWGSVAGVLVVSGLIIFLIVKKSKKDKKEKAE